MSITSNLRYLRTDDFASEIFIVSPKYELEVPGYEKLKQIAIKIEDLKLGTFSPVYHNEGHKNCTIRFKFYKGMKLVERNIYTVEFLVKKSERGDKKYVNCFINTISLHTRAKPVDQGEIMNF